MNYNYMKYFMNYMNNKYKAKDRKVSLTTEHN